MTAFNNDYFLVVGLGNPGQKYLHNRHNIGWLVFDNITEINQDKWIEKFKGAYTKMRYGSQTYFFLKPLTYMNDSGKSVRALTDFFKIPAENVLVIYDELDVDYGTLMFKRGGGTAGHNGLRSMVNHLGSKDFMRIRMGISRPNDGNVSKWVLSDFSKKEQSYLDDFLNLGADAIADFIKRGFEKAANKFSKQTIMN